jgi:DNA modification methylase
MPHVNFLQGDALDVLRTLPSKSVQCVVTSPPYYGLRDYGVEGQIGLEPTPDEYVARMVDVFREMRRVLRDDGTFWLNIGDCYARIGGTDRVPSATAKVGSTKAVMEAQPDRTRRTLWPGIKEKDRMMIPARVALALQADGWWLRDEIVWHKPRTTPFPANDRTVAAHEMVYLLTKAPRYYFDWAAIEEPSKYPGVVRQGREAFRLHGAAKAAALADMDKTNAYGGRGGEETVVRETRRARSVWSINPQPYREAHFATMPLDLAERCIKAGTRRGDVVLDPFGGVGTTALAATRLGRRAVLIELKTDYVNIARNRLGRDFRESLARLREAIRRNEEARNGRLEE